MSGSTASNVAPELESLVRQLAALPAAQRRAVIRAAEADAPQAAPGRVIRTARGDLVVEAPEWRPGRLDRAEIYAEDE